MQLLIHAGIKVSICVSKSGPCCHWCNILWLGIHLSGPVQSSNATVTLTQWDYTWRQYHIGDAYKHQWSGSSLVCRCRCQAYLSQYWFIGKWFIKNRFQFKNTILFYSNCSWVIPLIHRCRDKLAAILQAKVSNWISCIVVLWLKFQWNLSQGIQLVTINTVLV